MRLSATAATIPETSIRLHIIRRNDSQDGQPLEFAKGPRITYSVVSIFCMLLLAAMLGVLYRSTP
jgi:hypothetical protein